MGELFIVALILLGLGGRRREGSEPDYQPGPVDIPADWANKVGNLISASPKAKHFYQVVQGGLNAADVAGQVLAQYGANTGANRVRLIKCMTQIPWNRRLYASTRVAQSWGTLYNVDGQNLSSAWLPRNASAVQALAMRREPERTIDPAGNWTGGGTYYGLVWIPSITVISGELICDPLAEGPPKWLTGALQ